MLRKYSIWSIFLYLKKYTLKIHTDIGVNMDQSFKADRRFFDDKNYPRGFARHGDYTIREAEILETCGLAFNDLENGKRTAVTAEEKHFMAVINGEQEPNSIYVKTWIKYKNLISSSKRVYTLIGTEVELANNEE